MELNRQDLNKHIITHTHTPGTELTNNDMKRGQETNHIRKQEAGTQDTQDRGLTLRWWGCQFAVRGRPVGLGTDLCTFKGTDRIASVLPSTDSH